MNASIFLVLLTASFTAAAAESVPLATLDLSKMSAGWGQAQSNHAVSGQPFSIGGRKFDQGVGTHANSRLWIDLGGGAEHFQALVGVDDAAANERASVVFKLVGDGRKLWESGPMRLGQPARPVEVDLRGVQHLLLQVTDAGDGAGWDHADWADARFVMAGATKPRAIDRPGTGEPAVLLTPKPGLKPRLNGPALYGCRPGHPFRYRIPAQGDRPMKFSATGLPAGLSLDPTTGIITGAAPAAGEYRVTLKASNRHGSVKKAFKLVAGDQLALTPTLGWNHWYAHYNRITDGMMRQAVDAMISSGMADVGYQYVSIDDCWMNAPQAEDPLRVGPLRDSQFRMVPNRHFPDMKALTAYIHDRGLKAGIYTSPGPFTCGGFAGSYQFEQLDAETFANWGFDLLKYDWCSYGDVAAKSQAPELEKLQHPYRLMGEFLRQQPRDMVLNLCQYGMGDVWKWGAEVGGQSWRTAGDLGFELDRVFEVAMVNATHREWNRPGAWNDPDYIQIGHIGSANGMGQPKPSALTPTEQYSFMSLWALMAAPIFYSGDMASLDEFTLNVLCNPEVIDVNQDPLGECARVVPQGEDSFLMVKNLADGSKAVGLCNKGEFPVTMTASWADLGVAGRPMVRDVWRQRDLGRFEGRFTTSVPRRGVVLLRVSKR